MNLTVSFRHFLFRLLVFSILMALLGIGIAYLFPRSLVSVALPLAYLYFFVVAVVFQLILRKGNQAKPGSFITRFMGATTFKLLLSLMVLVIYAFAVGHEVVSFTISFFVLYIAYTAFLAIYNFKTKK